MTRPSEAEAILVLGAGGFLGPHLVVAARERLPLARAAAAGRAPEAAPRPSGWDEAVALESVDVMLPGAVEELLEHVRPTRIVLAAALARVGDCERDPERAQALNAELPIRVATWCAATGARLVHVSTDLVFGATPPRGERYAEEDPPSPIHAYGRSKADGEAAVLASGADALVVRLPLLFGDSGGRGLGASDALLAAVERGEAPALFLDEWRTPLDVRDAALAIVELLQRSERGVLHVAGPERLSRLELGLAVLEARGFARGDASARVRPARRSDLGLAELRPADVSLAAHRARRILGSRLRGAREALA